ncbi:MAG: hypothetical protein V4649_05835 [Bacteroidota bacterium]
MKKILSLLFGASLFASGCDKGITTATDVRKGVILHNKCCNIVVANIGNPSVGQATWIDSNTATRKTQYDVFKVANPCQYGSRKEGDTIYYRVIASQIETCSCCGISLYTPSVAKYISVVR